MIFLRREPSPWTTSVFNMLEYSIRGVFNKWGEYCTHDFTEMYRELYGLSYAGIMWPLPSEARVRSQGTRMPVSNTLTERALKE